MGHAAKPRVHFERLGFFTAARAFTGFTGALGRGTGTGRGFGSVGVSGVHSSAIPLQGCSFRKSCQASREVLVSRLGNQLLQAAQHQPVNRSCVLCYMDRSL